MRSLARTSLLAPLGLLVLVGPAAAETVQSEAGPLSVDTVAEGLDKPWALAFLPDGSMLVTEKGGALRTVSADGAVSEPIAGTPEVDDRGQGGLLDVAVHPDFAENRLVYMTFSEPGPDGTNSTALFRARLGDDGRALTDGAVIFSQKPKVPSTKHFGSRIVFDGKGHVFVGLGERSDEPYRQQAQALDSDLGKVVRLNEDGSVPSDNPFASGGGLPEIWSYGHRNIQSAALDPATGKLWTIEHGPLGGDEINIPQPGRNYGWPVVSFGVNYDGTPVGSGQSSADGMEPPIYQWTPVIAPSGMAFYSGALMPEWKGNLFVGGLKGKALVRLQLDGDAVVKEERLLTDLGERIRDVAEGPDGALYVVTDGGNASVLRIGRAD